MKNVCFYLIIFIMSFIFVSGSYGSVICNNNSQFTNIRKGPSAKNFPKIASAINGKIVDVIQRVKNSDGYYYYKIRFTYRNLSNGKSIESIGYVYEESVVKGEECNLGRSKAAVQKNTNSNSPPDKFYISAVGKDPNFSSTYANYFDATIRITGKPVKVYENTCRSKWRCRRPGTSRVAKIPVELKIRLKIETFLEQERRQMVSPYLSNSHHI